MKRWEIIPYIFYLLFCAYVLTMAVVLIEFYKWSLWTLIWPILIVPCIKERRK